MTLSCGARQRSATRSKKSNDLQCNFERPYLGWTNTNQAGVTAGLTVTSDGNTM
jgi:hypothetical protein